MLYSIDSCNYVNKIPHEKEYQIWKSHINEVDFQAVVDAINTKIDTSDINTAGWMPGHDWTGTVYEPLYYACGKNIKQSGMFLA